MAPPESPQASLERRHILARGIVQGVGFRPFVYKLAQSLFLKGFVQNDTDGVFIDIEGRKEGVEGFIARLLESPPPQALIEELHWELLPLKGYSTFEIRDSSIKENKSALIPPDIALCKDCLEELFNPEDRRYLYPFINCSHCGPRFTIAIDIPYDRANTTMAAFTMCDECSAEYCDPSNRRFHAQPNACPRCGPVVRLLDKYGRESRGDAITLASKFLKEGKIVAVKGLGGYHLACDALNPEAVKTLRERKYRWDKPFAVMAGCLEEAVTICSIDSSAAHILLSPRRPITLLRKRPGSPIAEEVAPGYKELGVMLPYTPLHHLLLRQTGRALVMTSGNVSDEPIIYNDQEVLHGLGSIADYFLVSNRPIFSRCDDSVVRPWQGGEVVIRRARGYVPYPLRLKSPFNRTILACGAMLKNTFCLGRGHHAFLSPHIGDLENLETLKAYEEGIERLKKMLYTEPEVVAYDLHPEYLSTKYALGLEKVKKLAVQHHHAHVVSCMAENGLEGEVIGVAFDGLGYGEDGRLWGGEFLLATPEDYRRIAHLEYIPMPGAEKAIKEPWRMVVSYLYHTYGEDFSDIDIPFVKTLDKKRWPIIKDMIDKGVNSPLTSSMGRLFDGISSLLGIRKEVTYEGQAAIELENLAEEGVGEAYPFEVMEKGGKIIIGWNGLIRKIVGDILGGVPLPALSARLHNSVARMVVELCSLLRTGNTRVVLSGGVFQNALLLRLCQDALKEKGFGVYIHHKVPTNDGGLCLGQAVVADRRLRACA